MYIKLREWIALIKRKEQRFRRRHITSVIDKMLNDEDYEELRV